MLQRAIKQSAYRSLIDSGKASRYFLYALGEIALVVIGILIALQINNWNEYRKDRELEIKILREIRSNLIKDFDDHNENMGFVEGIIRSSNIILDHLNNDLPFHDSLKPHFGWLVMAANFDAVKSGYELLVSQGVDIIQNDSLRNKISYVYGSQYSWFRSWLKDRQYLDRPPILNQMIDNFKVIRPFDYAIPADYEALKSNEPFKAAIEHYSYSFELTKRFYGNIIEDVEQLIIEIAEEIERLNTN